MSNKDIVITSDFGQGLIEILTHISITLQKRFDISPKLINEFINDPIILSKIEEKSQKLTDNIQDLLSAIDKCHNLAELQKYGSDQNIGWNYELCGYLIEELPNGYKKYCDQHKYLHNGDIEKHEFVFKSENQVLQAEIFNTKLKHYQYYLDKIYEVTQNFINEKIKNDFLIVRLKIIDVIELNEWLKTKEDCFKTKFIFNTVIKDSNNKFEYNNYLDIYIPKNKSDIYLQEIGILGIQYTIV